MGWFKDDSGSGAGWDAEGASPTWIVDMDVPRVPTIRTAPGCAEPGSCRIKPRLGGGGGTVDVSESSHRGPRRMEDACDVV